MVANLMGISSQAGRANNTSVAARSIVLIGRSEQFGVLRPDIRVPSHIGVSDEAI